MSRKEEGGEQGRLNSDTKSKKSINEHVKILDFLVPVVKETLQKQNRK